VFLRCLRRLIWRSTDHNTWTTGDTIWHPWHGTGGLTGP
jgi:hypothetical protein